MRDNIEHNNNNNNNNNYNNNNNNNNNKTWGETEIMFHFNNSFYELSEASTSIIM